MASGVRTILLATFQLGHIFQLKERDVIPAFVLNCDSWSAQLDGSKNLAIWRSF